MDLLAEALNIVLVHKNAGKDECKVLSSKLVGEVLKIMQREGYIGKFEQVSEGIATYFIIRGIGPINDCGTIKPRAPLKLTEVDAAEEQYLPSKEFGVLSSRPRRES